MFRARKPTLLAVLALTSGTSSCGDRPRLDPYASAVVEIDTNLPVPLAMSRLRLDVYSNDGRWLDSSDFARPDPHDYPTSFGLYTQRADGDALWVRIRGYLEGEVVDYRGERLRDWPNPFAKVESPPHEGPRLMRGDVDVTPREEPQPLATVDRLIHVRLEPKRTVRVPALLHGNCIGTMVAMEPSGLPGPSARSCVATPKKREPVPFAEVTTKQLAPSAQGTWQAAPCAPSSDASSPRVCIAGGATVIGSRASGVDSFLETGEGTTPPVRVFGVRRFYLDREEVTVARFRAAIERGLRTPLPRVNDGELTADNPCTYSTRPSHREQLPVLCLSQLAARDFCRFEGGDLPTEVEWEHAATVVGHSQKQLFPWGSAPKSCEEIVAGRGNGVEGPCRAVGTGPAPVTDGPGDLNPFGVHGLAGGAREWTRDAFAPFGSVCWGETPLVDPLCRAVSGDFGGSYRGGSWLFALRGLALRTSSLARERTLDASAGVGELVYQTDTSFRCAYDTEAR